MKSLAAVPGLTLRPDGCEPRFAMITRARVPHRLTFATLLLMCMWWSTLGCRPRAQGLGEGPPQIDTNTPVLAVFDAAS